MKTKDILDLPIEDSDIGTTTIRNYLKALLIELWEEESGFSGKRPFGNSGWKHDLFIPLVKAGIVDGRFEDYGDGDEDLVDLDYDMADHTILMCIKALK